MPLPPQQPKPIDSAALASKLPPSLQWLGGAGIELLKRATGIDDPTSIMGVAAPMTTIGPGAIPLFNHGDYLRKVLGESLEDLGHFGRKVEAFSPLEHSSEYKPNFLSAVQRLTNATQDPDLSNAVNYTTHYPGDARAAFRNPGPKELPHQADSETNMLIQALANAYHTKLGMK